MTTLAWTIVTDRQTQTLAVATHGANQYCVRWIERSLYLFHAYGTGRYRYLECSRDARRVRDLADAHLRMMQSDGVAASPEDDDSPI